MSEPTFGEDPILIQIRDAATGEWRDYGRCDAEKAGRILGWGDNANHYRAIHVETGVECATLYPDPESVEIKVGRWTVEEIAALKALIIAIESRHK